ncbi:MAG: polyhydroxyalkanoate synthesis repressor PhaR [Magnetococcales bacterium]|nr:polyhydroxyalkanoate synthesis repressor PhaR [Magnetococcales bacterium]
MTDQNSCVLIKKYANRRLYNTQTSTYIPLDDLAAMVRGGEDFRVIDAASNEDLTHSVLANIIFDAENMKNGDAPRHMLPVQFMRRLISLYAKGERTIVPQYLDLVMHMFIRKQDDLAKNATDIWGQNPFSDGFQTPDTPADKQQRHLETLKKTFDFLDVSNIEAKNLPKDETKEQIQALKDQVRKLNEELDRLRQGE